MRLSLATRAARTRTLAAPAYRDARASTSSASSSIAMRLLLPRHTMPLDQQHNRPKGDTSDSAQSLPCGVTRPTHRAAGSCPLASDAGRCCVPRESVHDVDARKLALRTMADRWSERNAREWESMAQSGARDDALPSWDRCNRSSRSNAFAPWITRTSIAMCNHVFDSTIHGNVRVVLHKNVSKPHAKHVNRLYILYKDGMY
mmetsp:Transcript_8063/g.49811  ORF Transcript_8063/g.49811 Transcript_8063/m.49811 type:complete len:202 (-) Transcript_8063:40-645(-)